MSVTRPTRRTMVADSPSVFRPFLQEFFVKASDPLFTCTLKLDVLTALVTKDNCATILGELQTYVLHRDKSFVCAAVRAVGRVADSRPEAADQCLHVRMYPASEYCTALESNATQPHIECFLTEVTFVCSLPDIVWGVPFDASVTTVKNICSVPRFEIRDESTRCTPKTS